MGNVESIVGGVLHLGIALTPDHVVVADDAVFIERGPVLGKEPVGQLMLYPDADL